MNTDGIKIAGLIGVIAVTAAIIIGVQYRVQLFSQADTQGPMSCPLKGKDASQCYEIVTCTRSGGGTGNESSCYTYIGFRCLKSHISKSYRYLTPLSQCRSKKQVETDVAKLCGCDVPSVTPTVSSSPTPSPTAVPPSPLPTEPRLHVCSSTCVVPCQLYSSQASCNTSGKGTCSWCPSKKSCINPGLVDMCNDKGEVVKKAPYESC